MYVIQATNVRDAYLKGMRFLLEVGEIEETREGEAMVAPVPVTIWYDNPKQHVLLNPIRDANPFFHLMEAMWMLAGRQDSAFLDYYIKDFGARYAVDGIVMDAYGYRWIWGARYNQLITISNLLRKDPTSRQAVLQMWGAGRDDLRAYSGKPCNLIVTFRIKDNKLNMHVFNRSNDIVWGCCGANAVHFPLMQEYIASRIGIEMGGYWQVTTNLHLYKTHYDMLKRRADDNVNFFDSEPEPYGETIPLTGSTLGFDEELSEMMASIDIMHKDGNPDIYTGNITSSFLSGVVVPMAKAHCLYKNKNMEGAMDTMEEVIADDWYTAGTQWLERRHHGK